METSKKDTNNKVQYKLIVLIATISYLNNKNQKYTQKTILYYFNENLKKMVNPFILIYRF
ncbi:hypothetical protein HNP70_000913 [Borreliella kurtenbachii]